MAFKEHRELLEALRKFPKESGLSPVNNAQWMGPFNPQQYIDLEKNFQENGIVVIWDLRVSLNSSGPDYWFVISSVMSDSSKGEWQMGYDKGYEDGKAAK